MCVLCMYVCLYAVEKSTRERRDRGENTRNNAVSIYTPTRLFTFFFIYVDYFTAYKVKEVFQGKMTQSTWYNNSK